MATSVEIVEKGKEIKSRKKRNGIGVKSHARVDDS